MAENYSPPLVLRLGSLQTALASSKVRGINCQTFERQSKRVVVSLPDGFKTVYYINRVAQSPGLIILLHGWLGSPQSPYVLGTAAHLYRSGYSVVRLTLPEHGEAVRLNGVFIDATRHDLVRDAIREICSLESAEYVGLLGFSLGGNCVLRIIRDSVLEPIHELKSAMVISPVIDPKEAASRIDDMPLVKRYFIRKFLHWYREKRSVFPDIYGANEVWDPRSIQEITEKSVRLWTDYTNSSKYFEAYTIEDRDLLSCSLPLTLLTADDDPIVSSSKARGLRTSSSFEKIVTRNGGHNGFFEDLFGRSYADRLALERFTHGFG